MSYEANCPCGALLQVGDHAAGKQIKCPRCGELIPIRETAIEEEEIPVVSLGEGPALENDSPEERTPCPYCAEMVLVHAKICPCCQSPLGTGPENACENCGAINSAMITECRNCGRNMIPGRQETQPHPMQMQGPRAATYASRQKNLSILDWVLGLFLPIVGVILGVVYLTSGRSTRGWQILGLSLIGFVIKFGCYGANSIT